MNLSFSYNYFTIFGTRIVEVFSQSDVGSNGNGRHYQDQTDRKNEQTMTQDKDLIFAQHTFFCFSATAQVAHLVLPDTQRQRFAKPKEPLFSNALNTAFQNFY